MPFAASPPHVAAFLLGRDDGAHRERTATVAWLRSYASRLPQHKQAAVSGIADAIGRGEHHTHASTAET